MKIKARSRAEEALLIGSIQTFLVSRSVKQTIALLPLGDNGNSDRISNEITLKRDVGTGKGVGTPRVFAL